MIELIVIIFLLALNGVFAMAEIALISSKKYVLEKMRDGGNKNAGIALKLLAEPEKFLSTIQIGITLVGIVAGAFGGLALAEDVEPLFAKLNVPEVYLEELSLVTVVAVITYLSLLVGELLPKTIALNNPEAVSIKLSPFISLLSIIATPVVSFLSFSTKILTKILGIKSNDKPPVTEEELKLLIEQGRKYGVLEQMESEMVKSVFRFYDRKAYSVMVPRQDILWIDVNHSIEEILSTVNKKHFSKYPLCDGSLENLIGIIHVRDLMQHILSGNKFDIKDLAKQPLMVPDNIAAKSILEKFRETKIYIAFVIDEFGSLQGMITLHDLIENVFGDLPEITETSETLFFERGDGSLLIDGSAQIDVVKEKLNILFEGEEHYSTLAGFVMYKLNKIPQLGDKFYYSGFDFEVIDMDEKRIDKVLVKKNIQ